MLQIMSRLIHARSRIENTILNIAVWNVHTSLIILFVTTVLLCGLGTSVTRVHPIHCDGAMLADSACVRDVATPHVLGYLKTPVFLHEVILCMTLLQKSHCSEGLLISRSFLHRQLRGVERTWRWARTFPGFPLLGDTSTKLKNRRWSQPGEWSLWKMYYYYGGLVINTHMLFRCFECRREY